ncbi:MAG: hypothetical protein ABI947_02580 [Chloroflexota bacterium]
MKHIYFARTLRGDDKITPELSDAIQKIILTNGFETQFTIPVDAIAKGNIADDVYLYRRDVMWIDSCDAMIAEVSSKAHGVGYEIAYAHHICHIPILLVARKDTGVSVMLTGAEVFLLRYYNDLAELEAAISEFLQSLGK